MQLDLPDRAFDLVLCQQGLQFFSDPVAALRAARRVLIPEGRVAFSVWRGIDLHSMYKALFEATANHLSATLSDIDQAFSLGDANQLEGLLRKAEFRRIDITSHTLEVRLPSPEHFVQLTVSGAATSVPVFSTFREGGELVFPMSTTRASPSAASPATALVSATTFRWTWKRT